MQKIHYVNISLIKQAMREKEVTVKDLAKLTGYTRRTIKKYLNGADQKKRLGNIFRKNSRGFENFVRRLIVCTKINFNRLIF